MKKLGPQGERQQGWWITSQGEKDNANMEATQKMIVNMNLQPADDTRSDETKQANGVMA